MTTGRSLRLLPPYRRKLAYASSANTLMRGDTPVIYKPDRTARPMKDLILLARRP